MIDNIKPPIKVAMNKPISSPSENEVERNPVVVGPRELQLFAKSDQSTIDALVGNLSEQERAGPRIQVANDTLPDFDQFPLFLEALRNYVMWLSTRSQANTVIETNYSPQIQEKIGGLVYWGRKKAYCLLRAARLRDDIAEGIHRSVPEMYKWLSILLKVIEEGNFAVNNGQNSEQREEGYEYLHAALVLAQRLREVAFIIEKQLRNSPEIDQAIEEVTPLDVILAELSGETVSEIERMRDAREGYSDDGVELTDKICDAEGLAEARIKTSIKGAK